MDDLAHSMPVAVGTQCVGCRYDLGGLEPRGACPECGLAIEESVGWRWLRWEPAGYRKRLSLAAVVVWASGLALILTVLVMAGIAAVLLIDDELARLSRSVLGWAVLALISFELVLGWWYLSAPSPRTTGSRGRDGMHRQRFLCRLFGLSATAVAMGGIAVLMVTVSRSGSGSPMVEWLLGYGGDTLLMVSLLACILGMLLCHLAGVWYLTRQAARLSPDDRTFQVGSLALALRQTGWIPIYALGGGALAVMLYPVAILMVGFFAIVPIVWAAVTVIVVPGALFVAMIRSVWLVARFGTAIKRLEYTPIPMTSRVDSHSTSTDMEGGA